MSAYQVNKLCRECLQDPELRARLLTDPDAVLAQLPLSEKERVALLTGDVAALYRAGASAFLLSYLPRWGLFGLDVPTYSGRMRAANDPQTRHERSAAHPL